MHTDLARDLVPRLVGALDSMGKGTRETVVRVFVWRGQRHRVVRADGPERLHGEWWRERGAEADAPYTVRDYFQVETLGGGRYWLFRLGDGERPATGPMQWFIHGAFA